MSEREAVARKLLNAYLAGDQAAGLALIDHLQGEMGLELPGMPGSVWVATNGDGNHPEERWVTGVFSTEENAKLWIDDQYPMRPGQDAPFREAIRYQGPGCHASWDEWDLDPEIPRIRANLATQESEVTL